MIQEVHRQGKNGHSKNTLTLKFSSDSEEIGCISDLLRVCLVPWKTNILKSLEEIAISVRDAMF